jgi:hypothetical protein
MKTLTIPVLMVGALWLIGCADGNHRPYTLDDSFGKTANHLVKAQISDPQAAANPPADSPRKMDGYAGVNTIRTFRNAFGQDTQPQPLTINIGGATGSGSSSGGQ